MALLSVMCLSLQRDMYPPRLPFMLTVDPLKLLLTVAKFSQLSPQNTPILKADAMLMSSIPTVTKHRSYLKGGLNDAFKYCHVSSQNTLILKADSLLLSSTPSRHHTHVPIYHTSINLELNKYWICIGALLC